MQHLETCIMTIGDGTLTIQSREVIGLEIKTPFIICVNRHQMQFINSNLTAYLSQEQKMVKFINEPSVDNPNNTEKVNKS